MLKSRSIPKPTAITWSPSFGLSGDIIAGNILPEKKSCADKKGKIVKQHKNLVYGSALVHCIIANEQQKYLKILLTNM